MVRHRILKPVSKYLGKYITSYQVRMKLNSLCNVQDCSGFRQPLGVKITKIYVMNRFTVQRVSPQNSMLSGMMML